VRLVEGKSDLEKGHLSISSPLGQAVLAAEEGEEVEFRLDDGRQRRALIESVEKGSVSMAPPRPTEGDAATAIA
jgi:transcription elongation GreA/GreB family factor